MRDLLRQRFKFLSAAWRNGLSYEVLRSAVAFFLLALLFFLVGLFFPDLRELLAGQLFATLDSMDVIGDDGAISALGLFVNNFQACTFIMLYGLIPFLQLPALTLGINAMMLGMLAAWYAVQGISPALYLALLLPHGIFELSAVFLALGVGLHVCGQLTRRCRGKSGPPVIACLALMGQMLLVITPLLAVAAVVEAYITPLAASLFF
jgi:stage II sporulation protein M